MESNLQAMGFGVAAPVAAATGALWLIWRTSPSRAALASASNAPPEPGRHIIAAITLPLIFGLAWALGYGLPKLPPDSGTGWLLPITISGALLGVVAAAFSQHGTAAAIVVWPARATLLAGGLWLIARNRLNGGWEPAEAWPMIGGFSLAGLAAWWALDRAGHERGGLAPMLVVFAVVFSSIAAILTGHLQPAFTPATLCAIVGPAFLVSLLRPTISHGPAIGFGAAFLGANWFATSALGETPWLSNALAAMSLVMVGVSSLGPLGRLRGVKAWLVRGAMVALPGLGAVAWALMNQPEPYSG